MQNYYLIDDLRLGPGGFLKRGWTIQRFSTLEEAVTQYRALPQTAEKSLGFTDGVHSLELVRCKFLFPDDVSGEDVLVSACRQSELWRNNREVSAAVAYCRKMLHLRYTLQDDLVLPVPTKRGIPKRLRGAYLWLNLQLEEASAIRWIYVAGLGWLSPQQFVQRPKGHPLVLKYRADCITENGVIYLEEMEPWEYQRLLPRSKSRIQDEKSKLGGSKHE